MLSAAATAIVWAASALSASTPLELACAAAPGERPSIEGVTVVEEASIEGDLSALRVTRDETGAFMRVYYDAGSELAARARAACLGAQLSMLEAETGDDRRDVEWFAAAFTQDSSYIPPRGPNVVARWPVAVQPDGALSPVGHVVVVSTIPHEQVHAYQTRAGTRLPRWVAEGHATWVQSRISPQLDAGVFAGQARYRDNELRTTDQPLNLAQWGASRPRREALMRQVSPEDRARMEADPNFNPTGAFRFGPGDMIQDDANTQARYAAAAAVFDGLEARHGADAVRAWIADLTSRPGPVMPPALAESVQRHFGETVSDLLAENPLPAGG